MNSIEELVAKWRAEADEIRASSERCIDDGDAKAEFYRAAELDDCADELEALQSLAPAALSAQTGEAVAELIEAATDAHDFAVDMARNSGSELDRRFYRLRAALASVAGK